MLPPGQMPHPPHKHRNSEFIFIREGNVEYYHDDKTERVGPGGVIFNASNQMHGMKNVGSVDAQYFVIAVGRVTSWAYAGLGRQGQRQVRPCAGRAALRAVLDASRAWRLFQAGA